MRSFQESRSALKMQWRWDTPMANHYPPPHHLRLLVSPAMERSPPPPNLWLPPPFSSCSPLSWSLPDAAERAYLRGLRASPNSPSAHRASPPLSLFLWPPWWGHTPCQGDALSHPVHSLPKPTLSFPPPPLSPLRGARFAAAERGQGGHLQWPTSIHPTPLPYPKIGTRLSRPLEADGRGAP